MDAGRLPSRSRHGLPSIALVLVSWLLIGVAGLHCGLPRFDVHPSGGAASGHQSTDLPGASGALASRPNSACPAKVATAVTPPPATALVPLGPAVAVLAFAALSVTLVTAVQRGPPSASPAVTGQGLLTRLCRAVR